MINKRRPVQGGMTLIELMVALAIGLFLAMAVTSVIVVTLRQQKVTAAVNERDQEATLAIAKFDNLIRDAGAGFANSWGLGFFGCALQVEKSGAPLLPAAASLPSPFNAATAFRSPVVAPLLIERGVGANGSDVLFVMGGNGSASDVPRIVKTLAGNALTFDTALGYRAGDLLVIAQAGSPNCFTTQLGAVPPVAPPAPVQTVLLGGTYAGTPSTFQGIVDSRMAFAASIGNVVTGAFPSLHLFGVGAADTLYQYDLLQSRVAAIANGVSHLFALYGVDTNGDGKIDSWVDPGASGWTAAAVRVSNLKIRQILAVRVAIVTHSQGVQQSGVSSGTIFAFESVGNGSLRRAINLTTAQQAQRYRVIEKVIPLRNNLLIEP